MKNLHLTLVPLGIVLMVAGCGGGGSSSSGSGGGIPTAAVKITSSNAKSVASGSVDSTSSLSTAAVTTKAPASPTGVVLNASSSSLSVMNFALAEFNRVRNMSLPAALATGAVTSNPLNTCTSGSGTASWNDVNNNQQYDVGDTISVTYNSCKIGNVTNNGSASFTFNTLSQSTVDFTLTSTNFSTITATETLTVNGDIRLSLSESGNNAAFVMSGTSLETTSSTNGSFKIWAPTGSVTNKYDLTLNLNTSTNDYDYAMNMSVASTAMGGSVSIVTSTTFVGVDPYNPTAGVMTITGDAGSYLTFTAQSDGLNVTVTGVSDTGAPIGPTDYLWDDL